jgi:energy-coupling factor transporter transmembrane protein EcfT
MAELTSFSYQAGDSILHHIDVRFKILFVILISLICLKLHFPGLAILTSLLLGLILHARLSLISGLKELRYFLILLFFIFVARVLSTDGPPAIELRFISVSIQGLHSGILVCWRLAIIVILGFAFISTTRSSAIKAAVQWFLKPVPFIPEKKVALMMGLILRFVPLIFHQAGEIAEAQKARGVENRKNPVYRLTKLAFPILRRTFERADNLVAAMEARAFTENRTDPELNLHKRDWICLIVVCFLSIFMLLL